MQKKGGGRDWYFINHHVTLLRLSKYDFCGLLSSAFSDGCPNAMKKNNIPCKCNDLKAGTYTMNNQMISIPKLGSIWKFLAKGDYKVDFRLKDRVTGEKLGCLHLEASVRDPKACKGWSCIVG
ncbi:ganglioside GM2 activator [Elysia marginata]|uniref:Ganglioside GM2 activator n=1 Tax=Elysia marginata TaxID=1093978 RepID=A0AAV4IIK5_9GAST|nr:ganglioside GM2 activator [Elysia marginata]